MDSIKMPTVVIKRRKTAFFLPVTHLVRHIKKKRHKIQLTYILVSNGVVRPGKKIFALSSFRFRFPWPCLHSTIMTGC